MTSVWSRLKCVLLPSLVSDNCPHCDAIVMQLPAPPRLTSSSNSTLYFELKSMATINCDVVGTLRPPAWFLDNAPLSADAPGLTIEDNGLTFSNVQVSHSGWYTCSAANQWGQVDRDFLVIVGASAAISIPPNPPNVTSSYSVQPGTAVVLPCFTQGIPPPENEWFMNDTKIGMNDNFIIEAVSNALVINNYMAEQAEFHCRASNMFGTVVSTSVLVKTLPLHDSIPNSLLDPYYDIRSGELVNLTCSDSSADQYYYTWTKNHLNVTTGSVGVQITVSGSIEGEESGLYCCQMRSNDSVLLDTRCTVVNVRLPSTLQVEPSHTSVVAGRDVQLLCSAATKNGIDYPVMRWNRGSQVLPETPTDSRFFYMQNTYGLTSLQIKNVSLHDQDVYTCVGENYVGKVSAAADLRVIESACASAVLNSSDAEEDVQVVFSSWSFSAPEDGVAAADIADLNGEKVFRLRYQGNAMAPEISQTVPVSASASQARLSARMRTSNSTLRPVIELTMDDSAEAVNITAINLTTVTLPFPSRLSWQWVESAVVDVVNMEAGSASLTVTMTFTGAGELGSGVFFDDVCLEFIEGTDESVPPVISSDLNLEFYLILISAVAGLSAILVVILFVFSICCLQAVKRRRKRKKKYQTKNNEEIPLEKVVKYAKDLESAQLTGFGPPHAKMTDEEETQVTQSEDLTQRYVTTSPQLVSQALLASNPVPVEPPDPEQLEGSTWPHPHQPGDPTLYMPLNPLSLEGESMYMAPGETPEHKKPMTPDEVEEVYDTPLPQDDDENDGTYDVVSDSGQNRRPSSEEDHYYI